ncbi:heterokaryon incompatibility protein [Beauveria bassiana ARSEF 2860]|uniref:Heterokaryon incompatibility protein n=1 Tax=Beauveria bassiana (strain ARSEF 2860) TaxID=655819 RepID=J4KLF5_BEAB2|nr:heterokaryon incompatibility protein [Beauveria bassiana ARSEF 2860]EJP62114.1 heterokaryon incompatibility protein [Beauveria bassiana ARSEF 2860]
MYFQNLRQENAEIRLIRHRLGPSSTASFDFETTIVSLNSLPPYHAISYTWGSLVNTTFSVITVNGHKWPISNNLHYTLTQVRAAHGKDTWLWVDSLCVDMDRQHEVDWQLAQMHRIFSSADSVFFCIGPAANDSDSLLGFLIHWGREAVDADISPSLDFLDGLLADETKSLHFSSTKTRNTNSFVRALLDVDEIRHHVFDDAINALSRRPNWIQYWAIQELVLSESGIILCGNKRMPLHHFYAIMRALGRVHLWRGEIPPLGGGCFFMPSNAESEQPKTLQALLTSRADLYSKLPQGPFYQGADPRDVIFAFLGLASDRCCLGLVPDHAMTTREVYAAATLAMARCDPDSRVLDLASFPKDIADLPTWVPDWSRIGRLGRQELISLVADFHLFRTSQPVPEIVFLDEYTLQRRGFACNIVRRVFRYAATFSPTLQDRRAACVDAMLDFVRLYAQDSTDDKDSLETRLWRTITAGFADDAQSRNGYRECSRKLLRQEPMPVEEISAEGIDWIQMYSEPTEEDDRPQTRVDKFIADAWSKVVDVGSYRTLFATKDGRMGLGPSEMQPGDLVAVLAGNTVPVILRQVDSAHQYLGQAYIEGMMHGELDADRSEYEYQAFDLV